MAIAGLTARLTRGNLPVVRVHYSADERKDPQTPEGAAWQVQAVAGYRQGLEDPAWLKEMEIVYGALGGTFLFPLWDKTHKPHVVIPPLTPAELPHCKLYGTYDHGHIHPAVYHVNAVCPDGRKVTLWEFAASQVPMRAIADIIKGHDVTLRQDGRTFAGNPYAGREVLRVADPAIFQRHGRLDTTSPYTSVGDIFRQKYGVAFQPGKRGADLMVASWLSGDLWLDPEHPTYQICSNCPRLIYELPRLRHKAISPSVALTRAQPEELVDKDNDAWDALKQFLRLFPSTVAPKAPRQVYGTFAWAQRQIRHKKPLATRYSRG